LAELDGSKYKMFIPYSYSFDWLNLMAASIMFIHYSYSFDWLNLMAASIKCSYTTAKLYKTFYSEGVEKK